MNELIEMSAYTEGQQVEITEDDILVYNGYFHICYYSADYGGFYDNEADVKVENVQAYRYLNSRPLIKG